VTGIDPAADRAHAATFAHPDLEQIDQQATFDVRGYAASATGIRPETVDLSEFEQRPLGDRSCGAVRLLVGAMSGTIAQLRDILVTPSHLESRLTAFLTTRAFEHYWSAHTLSLIADPSRAGEQLYAGPPSDTTRLDLAAWRPVRRAITSNLLGHDHVAQTATLGLVDSLLTARVARRLPDLDGRLSDVAGRLVDITSTHADFYDEQAELRLAASWRARSITRLGLRSFAWPVRRPDGTPSLGHLLRPSDLDPVSGHLAALPGLSRMRVRPSGRTGGVRVVAE
jgi:hypothetical protein